MKTSAPILPVPVTVGPGCLASLGRQAFDLGLRRPLVVADPGILAAGHLERALLLLEEAGLEAACFTEVRENPDTHVADACRDAAADHGCDGFIGLGGGSSMDAAKAANFLLTNGGRIQDYWGRDKAQKPLLPMIAVPTTAGTGSECQGFALITDPETHRKMACGDRKAVPVHILLDPELTLTQPAFVASCTAMDALSHAVETAVTNAATESSLALSHAAFRHLLPAFERMLEDPNDLDARGDLQMGAAMAGAAIEESMLGMAHALANPLTGHLQTVHGRAVGLALPGVVRFNGEDPVTAEGYRALWLSADPGFAGSAAQAVEQVAQATERLLHKSALFQSGQQLGLRAHLLDQLAAEAAEQWTARFNPRPLALEDFLQQYSLLLEAST